MTSRFLSRSTPDVGCPISDQLRVLLVVTSRLDEAGIAYMVSGSTAMNHYAKPRMTRDIDIVVELGPADVRTVVERFERDFYIDEEVVAAATAGAGMFNVIHEETVTKVDFIVRKSTEYRRVESERRVPVSLGDVTVHIVSAEDLVLSKLVWSACRAVRRCSGRT